ncbi:MAG TPA: nucleotidyltransferase domain-containing protein [Terriglobia bacterium]|nr:nucleotidyltransferase domain-containing protein [Terriglobia bacterium]
MIDEATINRAVNLLRQAAPDSTIIVFGSCARGQITEDSDLDVLVVEPTLCSRLEEMVRLRRVLRPLGIPADVLVASKEAFDYWTDTPSTIYYEVAREGRVFHAAFP